ncbi:MAG: hypothetical protein J7507_08170 [Pseudoxanthomonas sp.]|nr:hypothetical protein [Pseudoxanthomonas sp.]
MAFATFLALAFAVPARAAPDPATARDLFDQARVMCERDAGALWGMSLCGPLMVVDPADRAIIANQADADGKLVARDSVHVGVLSPTALLANTTTEWSGTRWTQLLWPLPQEPALQQVLLMHELFHRIQPALGLAREETGNLHLDTLEGRYLLQLEWRALGYALMEDEAAARRARLVDAFAFRQARRARFAGAAAEEAALEINEGLAEYTGVRLGLASPEQRRMHAMYALARFVNAPSFVRAFGYASGPAYGLLLDQADPQWRGKLDADSDLGGMLAAALDIELAVSPDLDALVQQYDPDGLVRQAEELRERERQDRLAGWRARLVDGPVLVLPLARSRIQFNPETLAALDGAGTVYPTLRVAGEWGELQVDGGAALVDANRTHVRVALPHSGDGRRGDGWALALKRRWTLVPGEREGDLTVVTGFGRRGPPDNR